MEKIPIEERKVIFELEKLIGKSIPLVKQIWEFTDKENFDTIGYVIQDNHITELSIKFLLECDPNRTFEYPIEKLPESIGLLSYLEKIDISFNSISFLPDSFFKLRTLREIYIGGNLFYELPDKFDSFPNLEKLHIADYRVTTSFISSNDFEDLIFINSSWILLPSSIGKIEKLKNLDLTGILVATYDEELFKTLESKGCKVIKPRETVILDKNKDIEKFNRIRTLMIKAGFYLNEAEIIYDLESLTGKFEFDRDDVLLFNEEDLILIEYRPGYISKIFIPEPEENRDVNEAAKFIAKNCKNFGKDEFLVETHLRYYDHWEDYH